MESAPTVTASTDATEPLHEAPATGLLPIPPPLDPPAPGEGGLAENADPPSLFLSALASGHTFPESVSLSRIPLEEARSLLSSPDFTARLSSCLPSDSDIRIQFARLAHPAALAVESILTSATASERLKLQAARDLLDRAGFTPVRKVQVASVRLNARQHQTINATTTELLED